MKPPKKLKRIIAECKRDPELIVTEDEDGGTYVLYIRKKGTKDKKKNHPSKYST